MSSENSEESRLFDELIESSKASQRRFWGLSVIWLFAGLGVASLFAWSIFSFQEVKKSAVSIQSELVQTRQDVTPLPKNHREVVRRRPAVPLRLRARRTGRAAPGTAGGLTAAAGPCGTRRRTAGP